MVEEKEWYAHHETVGETPFLEAGRAADNSASSVRPKVANIESVEGTQDNNEDAVDNAEREIIWWKPRQAEKEESEEENETSA